MEPSSSIGDPRAETLEEAINAELMAIPIAGWSFFFPAHVAVSKYIHQLDPAVGPFVARNPPPSFEGSGATWMVDELMSDDLYLDLVEALMRAAADQLGPVAFERGFLRATDPIELPGDKVAQLDARVRELVAVRPRPD